MYVGDGRADACLAAKPANNRWPFGHLIDISSGRDLLQWTGEIAAGESSRRVARFADGRGWWMYVGNGCVGVYVEHIYGEEILILIDIDIGIDISRTNRSTYQITPPLISTLRQKQKHVMRTNGSLSANLPVCKPIRVIHVAVGVFGGIKPVWYGMEWVDM